MINNSEKYDGPPVFTAYYSSRDNMLVICANKVGSRFFESFLGEHKKFNRIGIFNGENTEIIKGYKRKVFFFRTPLDRFFGWYKTFIYTPYNRESYEGLSYVDLMKEATYDCTFKKSCVENVYDFITKRSVETLRELLKWDNHTVPLYTFFEYTGLEPTEFDIFDIYDIAPFTLDRFGEWKRQYPTLPISLTDRDLQMLYELNNVFHNVYKEDYEILEPLVKPYSERK